MDHIGRVIYTQRIAKNWNQEDLCRGICAVSYLSKIETGKAEPSGDILDQLLERLEIRIDEASEKAAAKLAEDAYELVFAAMNQEFRERMNETDISVYSATGSAADLELLKQLASADPQPLSANAEAGMDQRQKAVQRIIQGNCEEALRLYPNAWMHLMAGIDSFEKDAVAAAAEHFSNSYTLAGAEGHVRVMLSAALYQFRCASRMHDQPKMKEVSERAYRIAKALGERNTAVLIEYNIALSELEAGNYEEAYAFFASLETPNQLALLMKAAAAEKTGRTEEAKEAVKQAQKMRSKNSRNETAAKLLNLIAFRLKQPDYLSDERYGEILKDCFESFHRDPLSGCESLLIQWMLEWYQAARQYKKAFELLAEYPWTALPQSQLQ